MTARTDARIESYLKAPYARILMPESGRGFTAEILEFPGCVAQGSTSSEALANLEDAARGWIEAGLDQGQEIPPPTTNQGFSGRVALRLPRGLHRQAVRYAERDGTSLNQFLVSAIAARMGAEDFWDKIARRWSGVDRDGQRAAEEWRALLHVEKTALAAIEQEGPHVTRRVAALREALAAVERARDRT